MFWGHRKTAQNVPCDHHVTILFFLFAYVEFNFFCCEIKFDYLIWLWTETRGLQTKAHVGQSARHATWPAMKIMFLVSSVGSRNVDVRTILLVVKNEILFEHFNFPTWWTFSRSENTVPDKGHRWWLKRRCERNSIGCEVRHLVWTYLQIVFFLVGQLRTL